MGAWGAGVSTAAEPVWCSVEKAGWQLATSRLVTVGRDALRRPRGEAVPQLLSSTAHEAGLAPPAAAPLI